MRVVVFTMSRFWTRKKTLKFIWNAKKQSYRKRRHGEKHTQKIRVLSISVRTQKFDSPDITNSIFQPNSPKVNHRKWVNLFAALALLATFLPSFFLLFFVCRTWGRSFARVGGWKKFITKNKNSQHNTTTTMSKAHVEVEYRIAG